MLQAERDLLIMEQRKRELLRQARIQQLFQQVEREPVGERLLNLLGDLMISGGRRLKARSEGGTLRVRRAFKP
jgi:hypothetical protein